MYRDGIKKHREVFDAWVDGADIQWNSLGGWKDITTPIFDTYCEYRVKPQEPHTGRTWQPKEGENFWFINVFGDLDSEQWRGDTGARAFVMHNVFPTEESAQREVERRKIIHDLWQCEGAEEFKVTAVELWAITYLYQGNRWMAQRGSVGQVNFSLPYFHTKSHTLSAISQIGEGRLSLLLPEST